ncbi:MAG TPA: T9SS type A sorting domain-containing protein, partial [Puia sp.]|nr:T9SS type A sorting domain-containing protein [Puia sp.]
IYDQSGLTIGNQNNTYYNWSNYKYSPSYGTPATPSSFSTSTAGMNCGSGFANGCSNPSLFGPSTLTAAGAVQGITLPVILNGFSAMLNNDKTITLDWNTQMEMNSSRFTIERSNDGASWTDIGTVKAKGNSALPTDYTFTDEHPAAGINYYRLRMEDLDNTYQYTQVVVIRTSIVSNISFFPNPARDFVNVSLGQTTGATVTVRLINQSGQVLQERQAEAGSNTILSFPVQRYAAGLYILSVSSSDGFRESSKLLISRS